MSAAPPGQPVKPPRRAKRGRLYALAIVVMVGGVGLFLFQLLGLDGDQEGAGEIRRAVFPVKRPVTQAKPSFEYHFDRNAIVDSRLLESRILGLATSGNLVVFDADSFALRGEKVLHRRATCLGPGENGHVLAGISNGCIVRVATADLTLERVDDVPGVPRWIGKRAKDGALVIAYQPDPDLPGRLRVRDQGKGRTYEVGTRPVLFLDSKDRLWVASDGKVYVVELETGTRTEREWPGGWLGVRGFSEFADGQVWAFGGDRRAKATPSFVARVSPGLKPDLLYQVANKRQPPFAPTTPITHVIDDEEGSRVIVVSYDSVLVSDRSLGAWKPLDALGGARRNDDALFALGRAHRTSSGILLTLERGGFMELTSEFTRRHVLEGQYAVSRPSGIVRLEKGMAFFGDGGPSFYAGGTWRALPDPVMPPAELLGFGRQGETERRWAAMLTIPLEGESSYVIAKAGSPRRYLGHLHGLRDVFLTARWDGKALTTLGREELPIEPVDSFATPDQRLWNVDDQGLWSFSGGRWQLVMHAAAGHAGLDAHMGVPDSVGTRGQGVFKSAIGEPLHFAKSPTPPYYGLPTAASSWALVRLDSNEAGGVPLIDEVPVTADGRRLLIHDLETWEGKKDELLLATDHGLCVFKVKYGTCEIARPDGLGDEVTMFRRDGNKRMWLGGRGLWVLPDLKHALAVHPAIPMLADTRVVAMAVAGDGRMVVGSEDRGTVFVTLPEDWTGRPTDLPSTPAPWDSTRPHEPSYQDQSLVLRECRDRAGQVQNSVAGVLLGELRQVAASIDPRVRVETDVLFDGHQDIVVRGAETEKMLDGVLPLLGKLTPKARFAVWKRQGSRGGEVVQVRTCPLP